MPNRASTWQKATALVPIALLSGAWTVNIASTTATASGSGPATLPDGTALPTRAIEAPASVSNIGGLGVGTTEGRAQAVVASASTHGIPAAALAAYQRAASILSGADPACRVDWALLAALGRVESDHGRFGASVLNADGVSTPGIYGPPLDGTNQTLRTADTDGGAYDQDSVLDRAVGPLQFIPSTWSVVGVDGDGDGRRNPQDIDDAALAAAVYLCSGAEDLSTDAGAAAAVFRYNRSSEYVGLVMAVADGYRGGDYSAVPTSSYAPSYFTPAYTPSFEPAKPGKGKTGKLQKGPRGGPGGADPTAGDPDQPVTPAEPTDPGGEQTGGQTDGQTGKKQNPVDKVGETVTKVPEVVTQTATDVQQATDYCVANLTAAQLDLLGGVQECVEAYLDGGANAVAGLLDALDLGGLIGGLLGKP